MQDTYSNELTRPIVFYKRVIFCVQQSIFVMEPMTLTLFPIILQRSLFIHMKNHL